MMEHFRDYHCMCSADTHSHPCAQCRTCSVNTGTTLIGKYLNSTTSCPLEASSCDSSWLKTVKTPLKRTAKTKMLNLTAKVTHYYHKIALVLVLRTYLTDFG